MVQYTPPCKVSRAIGWLVRMNISLSHCGCERFTCAFTEGYQKGSLNCPSQQSSKEHYAFALGVSLTIIDI